MNIHINDNQTEATINGVDYLLTPKETAVSTNGEYLAVIQDALYATKRFLTTECTELSEGIMQYLNEQDFVIVKSTKETAVSKPETYTIEQLKSEKIAVRCENNIQSGTFSTELGLIGLACYPIRVFWNSHLLRWDWLMYLNKVSKPSKKALFKTEDGVEIYEGDEYWFLGGKNDEEAIHNTAASYQVYHESYLRFSTRENALQYISDNKPEYSKRQYNELLDDLLEAFQQACWIEDIGHYDHLEISTWKRIQRTLIEAGKIKAEECYRQV